MFGYIVFNREELKIKDYEFYRTWYCGLCRELRERYGIPGQLSLSYDLTFVVLLLTALYEPRGRIGKTRCIVKPFVRHTVRKNSFTEYAADMNVLLMYYKCLDDWTDERKIVQAAYAKLLKPGTKKLSPALQKKADQIHGYLEELTAIEKKGGQDLDEAAGVFGHLMSVIFDPNDDVWGPTLRRMGFYMGKFVYLLDAYEDVEKDIKEGNYNPLAERFRTMEQEAFEKEVKHLCTMMMAQACQAFESLPIVKYGDILRNILYSGVWTKFETVSKKRRGE